MNIKHGASMLQFFCLSVAMAAGSDGATLHFLSKMKQEKRVHAESITEPMDEAAL